MIKELYRKYIEFTVFKMWRIPDYTDEWDYRGNKMARLEFKNYELCEPKRSIPITRYKFDK